MTGSLRQGDVKALGAGAALFAAVGLAAAVGIAPLMAEGAARDMTEKLGLLLLLVGGASVVLLFLKVDPAWPFSLGVATMIFSSHWENAGSPIALDRVLIGIGLCSLLLRARSPRDLLGRQPSGIHFLLICALLYGISSAVMAGTLDEEEARFALLDRFGLMPFILFSVAPAVFPDARRRRILLGTLTAVGAYLAYTSILGKLGPKSLVLPDYITDRHVGIHSDRARGPFVEAVANGLALFACGVAAVVMYGAAIDRRVKVAAAGVAAACGLSIILTVTRSVWLGSALALVVTLLATRETRRYFVPGVLAGVLLVLGAFAVIPGLQKEADERTSDQSPVWDRRNTNAAALRMVAERPLIGFGWATYQRNSSYYMRLGADYPLTRSDIDAHNVFLATAAQLGLIGFLLWGAAVVWAIGGAILRRGPPELYWWRIGLVAIASQWFVVGNFVPLGYAFPNALLWLWAGVGWAGGTALQPARVRPGLGPSPGYMPAR